MKFPRFAAFFVIGFFVAACVTSGGGDPASITRSPSGPSEESQTAPDEELYAPLMTACLEPFGYEVNAMSDGGLEVIYAPLDVSDAERARLQGEYENRFEECLASTGFDRPSGITVEEDYEQFVATQECFREQGYDVAVPTLEQFRDGVIPDDSDVLPSNSEQLQALLDLCQP